MNGEGELSHRATRRPDPKAGPIGHQKQGTARDTPKKLLPMIIDFRGVQLRTRERNANVKGRTHHRTVGGGERRTATGGKKGRLNQDYASLQQLAEKRVLKKGFWGTKGVG